MTADLTPSDPSLPALKGLPMSRRIVSGLDSEGKSAILIDEELQFNETGGILAWLTTSVPADNTGTPPADVVLSLELMQSAASTFIVVRIPPGTGSEMHATDTIDYITMISGRITFGVETGSLTLSPGDVLVDRGIVHSWRNDGDEDAVYTVVAMPASPVVPRP
ncbi:cupin domain-containing protein [Sphingomonas oligophenolica]|uniref:Cupin domain-containing protein n=1 Tax=Sphingomonas oligophenolica TaxID=301154 RepID=A0ABU9YA41_9SPHN